MWDTFPVCPSLQRASATLCLPVNWVMSSSSQRERERRVCAIPLNSRRLYTRTYVLINTSRSTLLSCASSARLCLCYVSLHQQLVQHWFRFQNEFISFICKLQSSESRFVSVEIYFN